MRLAALALVGCVSSSLPARAQAAPTFDVATIKRSDPAKHSGGFHVRANRVFIENQDVQTLLLMAYSIHPAQIVGAPDWFTSERFDINGVADSDTKLSVADVQVMVRKLLTDRFGLTVKQEKRELPAYALTVAKDGLKLAVSKGDPNGLPNLHGSGQGNMTFQNASMTVFLLAMQDEMDRPLVDQTGLTEKYDFVLRWSPDTAPAGDADAPPGIFTAVQEQLGLKLVPVKAPVDVVVVEGASRPSEN